MEFLISDIVRYVDKNQRINFEHREEILRRFRQMSGTDDKIFEEHLPYVLGNWHADFLKQQEKK